MAIDPLKGVPLPQPWRGWFERLRTASNDAATKVPGMAEDNVFVADANGDLKDSGSTLPSGSSTGTLVTSQYVGERYNTESELPEAGTEEGARHGSFRIGLLTEDDYAYFDENGKLIFYGITGVQILLPLNDPDIPTKFAVFDSTGNLKYRTAEQLASDLSDYLATRIYGAETFITENLLEEAGLQPTHSLTDILNHVSDATLEQILKADANGLPVDATNTDTEVASAVSLKHAKQHAITTAADHTSTATSGKMLKADANGLPVDATNTDAQVSSTVTASHGVNDPNSSSEPAGTVATHAALITGVHGLVITAGKTLTVTESLILNALPIGGIAVATTANVLGSLAVGLTTQILVGGGAGTVPAWTTDIPTAATIGAKYIYRADGTDVPVVDGGTGASTLTDHSILLGSGTSAITPLTVLAAGELLIGDTGADPHALSAGATTTILVGGGAADPVWTTATGSGAPVRATSPTLVTPLLGTPTSGTLTNCTGLPQTAVVGLTTADSPVFVTVKLSGLTDDYIPYHVNDATGLANGPTKTNVDSAVSLKHTQGSDTALGAVGTKNPPIDADKIIYRDSTAGDVLVTSTWTQVKAFLKTYFDTIYVAVTGRYRYAAALADTATVTLPTITGNYPAHGFIHCAHASTGVISESAEFEFGSTGEVQIIRGTANIEAGGATAGKISLGPVADANPVVIKNNLGGGVSVNVMITLWYN